MSNLDVPHRSLDRSAHANCIIAGIALQVVLPSWYTYFHPMPLILKPCATLPSTIDLSCIWSNSPSGPTLAPLLLLIVLASCLAQRGVLAGASKQHLFLSSRLYH